MIALKDYAEATQRPPLFEFKGLGRYSEESRIKFVEGYVTWPNTLRLFINGIDDYSSYTKVSSKPPSKQRGRPTKTTSLLATSSVPSTRTIASQPTAVVLPNCNQGTSSDTAATTAKKKRSLDSAPLPAPKRNVGPHAPLIPSGSTYSSVALSQVTQTRTRQISRRQQDDFIC